MMKGKITTSFYIIGILCMIVFTNRNFWNET